MKAVHRWLSRLRLSRGATASNIVLVAAILAWVLTAVS